MGAVSLAPGAADRDWPVYLGDKSGSHFSTLGQITTDNVASLQVAWTYHAGEARPDTSQIQCNPLVIDGVIYATTPSLKVVALEAKTGRELWRFAPPSPNGVNRGLAWWSEGEERRLLYGNGQWLHALDPRTGQLIESFGDHGRVDLGVGLGRDISGLAVQANTPGMVYRNLIVMGMRVGEGPAMAAPGHIRAYDVRTGKIVWTFHTIPSPGEPNYETWPGDAWQRTGGANSWAGFALDEERGLLFCPVGSATFDFWGGDRIGTNLYADSLLVLEAATGKYVWHFQFTHHDLWDRDPPSPPVLLTVKREGRDVAAVAQTTKSGHVWVFDRVTGESLFPWEEVAVPTSDLAGEVANPTQPLPLKPAPFSRQVFSAGEITDRTPDAHRAVLNQFARLRAHVPFAPPSREGTIIFPGFDGGAEWGGSAVDPSGVLYVNANEMPWVLAMIDTSGATTLGQQIYMQNCVGCHGPERKGNAAANIPSLVDVGTKLTHEQAMEVVTNGRAVMPSWAFLPKDRREAVVRYVRGDEQQAGGNRAGAETDASAAAGAAKAPAWPTYLGDEHKSVVPPPFTHTGYNRFLDPDGYPAIKPPWGTLNAIDLNTGDYLWRIPFGEYPELAAKGVPPTGSENYGGPLVTAGGVLFIGATRDGIFHAYDRRTGKELWRYQLPFPAFATPATYEVDGRQYIVIACGGGKIGTKSGDVYLAFALPQ